MSNPTKEIRFHDPLEINQDGMFSQSYKVS